MCVITIVKNKIDDDVVKKMWDDNPDGAGIAWWSEGKLFYKKGIMTIDELIKIIKTTPPPFVFHCRTATSGGVNQYMTHPFTIPANYKLNGTAKSLLFHNGVENTENLYISYCLIKKQKYKNVSDTFQIASLLSVLGVDWLKSLKSKFVLLTERGFKCFGSFIDKKDYIVSNDNYDKTYYFYDYDYKNFTKRECEYRNTNDYENCKTKNYHRCSCINLLCPYRNEYKY